MKFRFCGWLLVLAIILGVSGECFADEPADWELRLKEVEAKQKSAPTDFELKIEHARLLGKLGRYQEQLKEGNELLAIRPKSVDVLQIVEAAYVRLRDYKEALLINTRILGTGLANLHSYSERSALLLGLRDYKGAVEAADKAISMQRIPSFDSRDLLFARVNKATASYYLNGPSVSILRELEQINVELKEPSVDVIISKIRKSI